MKSDVMPSIVQMDPEVLKDLVREVKETVATNQSRVKTIKPSFGIVDLWNIRRNAKTCSSFIGR
jgi:hypothetical protein